MKDEINVIKLLILYLKYRLKETTKKFFSLFNYTIIHNSIYKRFLDKERFSTDIIFLDYLKNKKLTKYLIQSKSELRQDLFVINELNFKKRGFFVEIGAGNGIDYSNTYLLEKNFNWTGIISEPAKMFKESLNKTRKCKIDNNALHSKDNTQEMFNQNIILPTLSSLNKFIHNDGFFLHRLFNSNKYLVNTITLNSLLKKYNAPKIIDYLSIDTEGSEYEILKDFNFKQYQFRIITSEHNFTDNRNKIYKLLKNNGYVRKYTNLSSYEDWYVKSVIK